MFYRIADIVLDSDVLLPNFTAFSCEPAKADVTLTQGGELPFRESTFETDALKVFRLSEGWFFQPLGMDDAGLTAAEDYTRLYLTGENYCVTERDKSIEWLVRIALECLLIRRGYVSLHAAAVEVDGEAYAFTGPSGMGKSTRANAWREAFRAELISGDRPLICVETMEANGVPWDGKERCYRNVRFPLKMICEIRRSKTVYARALGFEQRRRLLMQQSFLPMWDTETSAIQMVNITKLARTAQIVRIFCGPNPEDAKAVRSILEQCEWKREELDMKAKSGFTLRNVVGEHVLMPTGDNIGKFNGTVVLNEVAAFVWEKLQDPVSRDDLLAAVLDEYDVEEELAAKDLDELLEKLNSFGVIDQI